MVEQLGRSAHKVVKFERLKGEEKRATRKRFLTQGPEVSTFDRVLL